MQEDNLKKQTSVLDVVISNGYIQEGYGYKKVTKKNTHWITLFGDNLQMYAYYTGDSECEKIYDTGIIEVSVDELQILIKVLNYNHA
jgi:hypothetical protein